MPTCPKCKTENPEDSKFCINCGAVLQPPISESPETPPVQPTKSKKPLIIIGILLVFLAIAGFSAFVILPKLKGGGLPKPTEGLVEEEQPFPAADLTLVLPDYNADSDFDKIPDIVEQAIGSDPYAAECQQKLVACELAKPYEKFGAESVQNNLVFILDASGSMGQGISEGVKIEVAKKAIGSYVKTLPKNVNVALVVYGHKGSNSEKDKAISCTGIEVVYPLSPLDQASFLAAVDSFAAVGWTPMGGALRKVKNEVLIRKENQNNQVILVSDGIETCDSQPVEAAKELASTGANIRIDVIGFAVDSQTEAQLKEIAEFGSGTYSYAGSSSELYEKFEEHYQEWLKQAGRAFRCSLDIALDVLSCWKRTYRKGSDYVFKESLNLSGDESKKLSRVRTAIHEEGQRLLSIASAQQSEGLKTWIEGQEKAKEEREKID